MIVLVNTCCVAKHSTQCQCCWEPVIDMFACYRLQLQFIFHFSVYVIVEVMSWLFLLFFFASRVLLLLYCSHCVLNSLRRARLQLSIVNATVKQWIKGREHRAVTVKKSKQSQERQTQSKRYCLCCACVCVCVCGYICVNVNVQQQPTVQANPHNLRAAASNAL